MAYATRAELERFGGLPTRVLSSFDLAKQDDALAAASSYCDGYLRNQHKVPMVSPSDDLKIKVCEIAAYFLVRQVGFSPESGTDQLLVSAYSDAKAWLEQVAKGVVVLVNTDDATPDVPDYGPSVSTTEPRGW